MFEYSDGYSTQDSRNSTGSISFSGSYESSTVVTDVVTFQWGEKGSVFGGYTESYVKETGRVTGRSHFEGAPNLFGAGGFRDMEGNGHSSSGIQHAGIGTDVTLAMMSTFAYGAGVYEDARAGQIAKHTKEYLKEYKSIRDFSKSYKTGRQAVLASNIIRNVNMLDAIELGSKRMIGVGLVLGIADMANNDFSNESVGWFAADTIMTGVGLTGWGAPVAGVYFLGRFAYGIYDMSKK
jgi:hypothetical protein